MNAERRTQNDELRKRDWIQTYAACDAASLFITLFAVLLSQFFILRSAFCVPVFVPPPNRGTEEPRHRGTSSPEELRGTPRN
jgi:hypothetical protein